MDKDPLDEPIEGSIRFRFSSIPVVTGIRVPTPPIWVGGEGATDYLDFFGARTKTVVEKRDLKTCYFCYDLELMDGKREKRMTALPEGFYCGEFLRLDPTNIQEFLVFQQKYGLVYGAREHKPFGTETLERLRPEPDHNVFSGINGEGFSYQLEGIEASAAIFDSRPEQDLVEMDEASKLGAVSFLEAIAAVLDAQQAIRDTTRVLRDDLPTMTKREAGLAKISSEYVARFLPYLFPSIELVAINEEGKDSHSDVSDLITAVFAQLARGLLNNEAFRVCRNPECGRLFTPREMMRRMDTSYCCSECQERAKRLRYIAKHS
ncbi:MAG: hypothetical protein K5859_00900 [Atopobiaceae bacterium]|nr:hypothetical protein [Atopobiaceae bacterium]